MHICSLFNMSLFYSTKESFLFEEVIARLIWDVILPMFCYSEACLLRIVVSEVCLCLREIDYKQ